MRTQLRVGVIAAVLLVTAALTPTPAFADPHPARLTEASLRSPVNATPGAPVTIAWTAEDEVEPGSGVSYVTFNYETRDSAGAVVGWAGVAGYYVPLADRRSLATGVLTPWAAEGHYTLVNVDLRDNIGNFTRYARDGSVTTIPQDATTPPAPFDFASLDFDVTNSLQDIAIPTVTDMKPVQKTVLAGEPVIVTSAISDDRSGAAELSVRYTAPSGVTEINTGVDQVLATAGLTSGVLPLGAEAGTWRATVVQLQDRAGNRAIYLRDQPNPIYFPLGVRPFQDQPAIDFAALDIDVKPLSPDFEAPLISDVSREGPDQLHGNDDVVMHYRLSDASAIRSVDFLYSDVNGHRMGVRNWCLPERGTAVDTVPLGFDPGPVILQEIMVIDDLHNARYYYRDGRVFSQNQREPDAVPGIDLSAFDFEFVAGASAYTGHPNTRVGCPTIPKLPLTVPATAVPGEVIDIAGQVLSGTDNPLPAAQVAVFTQPQGQSPRLLDVTTADSAGRYVTQTAITSDTSVRVRFLGRDGTTGAAAATSEPKLVRLDDGSAPPPDAQSPGAGDVMPTMTAPAAASYGSPVTVRVHGRQGSQLELWAYSRPSTTYRLVRTGTVDRAGTWSTTIRPATNTRMFVRTRMSGDWVASPNRAVQIRTAVTLRVSAASSAGRRTFTGTAGPALAGRLISIYRTGTSGPQLFARVRTTSTGAYTLTVTAPRGYAVFDARTAATDRNAAGISPGVGTS